MKENQLYLNMGPGPKGEPVMFKEVGVAAGVGAVDCSHSSALFDYDGDGKLDLYLLTNRIAFPDVVVTESINNLMIPGPYEIGLGGL